MSTPNPSEIWPDAWITVSRSALRHNFVALQHLLSSTVPPPQIIAVVKANGFGHGAGETARILEEAGADFFAVTTPLEALELRDAGVTARILVFLPPLPEQLETLIDADCDLTLADEAGFLPLAEAARRKGKKVNVHLKVDTGMGRLGVLPAEALLLAQRLDRESSLHFAGIYTHFARALEKDESTTREQFRVLRRTAGSRRT